jgi:hypothetical protein
MKLIDAVVENKILRLVSGTTGYSLYYSKAAESFIVYDNENFQLYCGPSEDVAVMRFSEDPEEYERKITTIANHIQACSERRMNIIKISGKVFSEIMNSSVGKQRYTTSLPKEKLFGSVFKIPVGYGMMYSVEQDFFLLYKYAIAFPSIEITQ